MAKGLLIFFGLVLGTVPAFGQKARAGNHVPLDLTSPSSYRLAIPGIEPTVAWTQLVQHPGATYLALHFAEFDLGPADYLKVSDSKGGQTQVLTGKGLGQADGFWSRRLDGDSAVIELVVVGSTRGSGLRIDKYSAGLGTAPRLESIIRSDDTENAVCYRGTTEYQRARAVARILVHSADGDYWGTGFLVSSQNHLLTARHLLSTVTEAQTAQYEFLSEAPDCSSYNCAECYAGDYFYGSELVRKGTDLDYTLVRLTSGNPASIYGFLELENRGAVLNEEIYVPQHPAGRAKEFAIRSDHPADAGGICRIQTLGESSCSGPDIDYGYYADTEAGSSGAPVLSRSTHKVLALHHCGGLINGGIPATAIYDQVSCYFSKPALSMDSADVPAAGGTVTVNISLGSCAWSFQNSGCTWVSASPASGTGSRSVTLTIGPNYACSPRQCTVTFSGAEFTVNQAAGSGVLSLTPEAVALGHAAQQGAVEAEVDSGCAWMPSSSADWLTIVSVTPAGDRVLVAYSLTANPDTTVRAATIAMGQRTFVLSQSGRLSAPTPGTYQGLFAGTGTRAQTHSGFCSLTFSTKGTFTARLQIGSKKHSFAGSFDAQGVATQTITRPNSTPLTLRLEVAGPEQITGSVSDGQRVADLELRRAAYNGKTTFAPQQGRYTVAFTALSDSPAIPHGSGYGTVTVSKAGKVAFAGSLADGTKVSQAVSIGLQGEWPLYVSLYGGSGSIFSNLRFGGDRELDAEVDWVKPAASTSKTYSGGFQTTVNATGCEYSTLALGGPLDLNEGELSLFGGSPVISLWGYFFLDQKNKAIPYGKTLKLKLSTSTGTISGKMVDPATGKWQPFSGVVLQHWNYGTGYFLRGGLSGLMGLRDLDY